MTEATSKSTDRHLVVLRNAHMTIRGKAVIRGAHLRIAPGEVLGVWGPNGAGKSTLAKIVAGTWEPDNHDRGAVRWQPDLRIGYLCENVEAGLLPWLKAFKNCVVLSRREMNSASAVNHLKKFGFISPMSYSYPLRLSGGQRQRLAWACATAGNNDLLVLDEPFSHQDSFWTEVLIAKLRSTACQKRSVLLVTHDPEAMVLSSDRVLTLSTKRNGPSVFGKELRIELSSRSFDDLENPHVQGYVRQLRQLKYAAGEL